jgi:hypothetical protein
VLRPDTSGDAGAATVPTGDYTYVMMPVRLPG